MGRKIGSVISPPPRFHRFIKLWEYCPLSLPRKKEKEKNKQNTNKKTNKTKQKTKTENTHTLPLRNLPKHCDVCRIIFLPCCHSLIGTWLSKTWQRGVATWLCFSLIVPSRLVATESRYLVLVLTWWNIVWHICILFYQYLFVYKKALHF